MLSSEPGCTMAKPPDTEALLISTHVYRINVLEASTMNDRCGLVPLAGRPGRSYSVAPEQESVCIVAVF